MLPSLVAAEVRETLLDYLRTTWSLSDREAERELFRFLESDREAGGAGIFQGPFLRLRLPFEPAPPDARHPLDLRVSYTPYKHQLEAWQRLSSKDDREPRPTIVVTGTGSGKTEAFLLPILDHCLRARDRGEKGIKAVVLYPMNALAADQARRIGEMVWGTDGDSPMRGKLRVGMYVGGDGKHRVMGPDHVIDDRRQLREEPPDILLTNYKMLDFLLLRPADRRLWEGTGRDTLRYLVLDELHTYDGAQGTDVACLVRRLAARLGSDGFCPVGTSATVTSEDGSGQEKLLAFATSIFGRTFSKDSIVGESRRSASSFFGLFGPATRPALPADTGPLAPTAEDDIDSYVGRVAITFFPDDAALVADGRVDRARLGDRVARHGLARTMIELSSTSMMTLDALDMALGKKIGGWSSRSLDERRLLVDATLAMISWAEREAPGDRTQPLLSVQVQAWVREVRRLVRAVAEEPRFAWRDEDPNDPTGELHLPMYQCRWCGHSGWVTVHEEITHQLSNDLRAIGQATLRRLPEVLYLHRDDAAVAEDQLPDLGDSVCPKCSRLGSGATCTRCHGATVAVHAHRATSRQTPPRDLQRCPSCGTDGSLGILASRAASLASVSVGHLYTTPFNSDRKLLAFSDSVQDASHRAGFFSGRTYRFSLRTAMLATVPDEGSIRLTDVPAAMMERWGTALKPGEMIAAFMPRDLDYFEPYQAYIESIRKWRKEGSQGAPPKIPRPLELALAQRLQWEVTREVGLAARIGRTLERVGSASVQVDRERFDRASSRARDLLPNRVGAVREVEPDRWPVFIAGLLARVRLRGGIFDPLLRLYFQRQGHGKFLSKREVELLSPFGRFTSRPSFLTNEPEPKRFDTLAPPRRDNWYTDWARRALGQPLSLRDATELYEQLLPLLVEARLVRDHTERRHTAWAIEPDALHLTRGPFALLCDTCNHGHAALEGDAASLLGAPCLRFRCDGTLRRATAEETRVQTYYRRFYERRELGRVWAYEHTGLLEREDRESLESDFKDRYRPDAPNMLSCTPTLEMGIDIGDLSATMLISVPPSTSSYLQRIGRAGRKTGNALVLTFTTVRSHDLYFFEDPEAAMAGPVEPPGCYLDAPEILKRQALAWCLDAWAREAPDGEGLPGRVRGVVMGDPATSFPVPFFRFVSSSRDRLRESFLAVFGTSDATRLVLERYLSGAGVASSPMEQSLLEVIEGLRRERDDLRRLHRRVREKLKALEEAGIIVENADEEREELDRERRFLEKELAAMQDQSVLGVLSERSVLPNYAFPETGVELRAYVSKESRRGGSGAAERYKWVRSASTAIRELAPFNTFYGMARKVRVDTVDVGSGRSGRSGENIERWQLCAACGHMAPHGRLTSRRDCPRCGAPDWREQGRSRELVRMAKVAAFSRQRDAAFSDESDDRDRERYVAQTFFDPDPGTARHAWLDRQTPFGFELLPDLTIREINFGRLRRASGTQRIAGRDVPDVDFVVCEECGQVHDQDVLPQMRHRRWCTARTKPEEKQPWRQIHLFREVTTEALRMFVPVSMLDPEVRLPNLRAALALGMRVFFGGDPDHLRVESYDEPSREDRDSRRRFMVIHDTVPGGTGVLAELAEQRGAKLRQVLVAARDALGACSCAQREAPACYRCLYAYRHQDDLPVLDRRLAIELVEQLLAAFDRLETVDTIGVLDTASVLESELERRFVDELSRWAQKTEGASMERAERDRWNLVLGERRWTLQAQVDLDPAHDVAIPTRPDFVLWPEGQGDEVLAVAVYCDGEAFHVQPHEQRARLADDFAKREAVRRSGRFRVCSLAWRDLDAFVGRPEADIGPWLEAEQTRRAALNVAAQIGQDPLRARVHTLVQADPVTALVAYLADPDVTAWNRAALLLIVATMMDAERTADAAAVATFVDRLRSSEAMPVALLETSGADVRWSAVRPGGHPSALLFAHTPVSAVSRLAASPDALELVLRLDDTVEQRASESFSTGWRHFLRAHNALQGIAGLRVVTTEQLLPRADLQLVQAEKPPIALVAEPVRGGLLTSDAASELDEADARIRPALEAAVLAGAPVPDIPYEHGGGAEGFDAQVEAGWPSQRVGIALPEEVDDANVLREAGWKIFDAEQLDEAALLDALKDES